MSFAFLFPGQGAQKLNMMSGFFASDVIKKTFDEASSILNLDLWQLLQQEDTEIINKTIVTQPLLLTAGIAVYRAYLVAEGKPPCYVAGHSLGEYSALVAAESLDFSDAVRLVRLRAEFMQLAVPEGTGAMAAILGLADSVIKEVCREANRQGQGLVQVSNYNAINQVVIAGEVAAVELAISIAKNKGAKRSVRLPVSVPSHCQLMQPAADQLAVALESIDIKTPQIKVIHNVDVRPHTTPETIKYALIKQLYSPVRWTETILYLLDLGIDIAAECAPTRVLTDLNKHISKDMMCTPFLSMSAVCKWIKEHTKY